SCFHFFFQAEDGIRDYKVTGVQTCALPIFIANINRNLNNRRSPHLQIAILDRRASRRAAHTAPSASGAGSGTPDAPAGGLLSAEIGRASCRERGSIWVVVVSSKKIYTE